MVSNTKQTFMRRASRKKAAGKRRKRDTRAHGTIVFPVHPEGYDTQAADAKGQKPR
ncbi:MAG: hypothetical protein IT373_16225 [Polyangiaceae bacterium]|nr:hypothetical protein [Polyangiaceae bacterium]